MSVPPASTAIVLFSGGQDSTVCLAWALERYGQVETVGFDYGQRHRVELDQRAVVRDALCAAFPHWAGRLGPDTVLDLSVLGQVSETALTRDVAISAGAGGLPNTFVPGRNLLFLTLAGALAWRRGAGVLVGGMCETDYSGYPDCRRDTLDALQHALVLGMDRQLRIETPLMRVDKAGTWRMAQELGGPALVDITLEHTHTCYAGNRTLRHEWGYGCGVCPACELRAAGYERWRAAGAGGAP